MLILLDDGPHKVNLLRLSADLEADGLHFVDLNVDGALRVYDPSVRPEDCVSLWQARAEGEGIGNSKWGDLPGGYEFCSSGAGRDLDHRAAARLRGLKERFRRDHLEAGS